jgi:hypothetical protein
LTDIKVIRGIENGNDYNTAAENVVKKMPTWIPGEKNNKKVRVKFILPIKFSD